MKGEGILGVFGKRVAYTRRSSAGCNRNPGMRRSVKCDTELRANRRLTTEATRTRCDVSPVVAVVVVVVEV